MVPLTEEHYFSVEGVAAEEYYPVWVALGVGQPEALVLHWEVGVAVLVVAVAFLRPAHLPE